MRRFHLPLLSSCHAASDKGNLSVRGNGGLPIVNTPMFFHPAVIENAAVNMVSLNTR